MINPMDALSSLQAEIHNGIPLRTCIVNSELKVFVDQPGGRLRFTFVKITSDTIQAIATFMMTQPIDGHPALNLTFAVLPECRNQGLATEMVTKCINEMKYELQSYRVSQFYVEALTETDDSASQKIASRLISAEYESITHAVSKDKAYRYCGQIKVLNN